MISLHIIVAHVTAMIAIAEVAAVQVAQVVAHAEVDQVAVQVAAHAEVDQVVAMTDHVRNVKGPLLATSGLFSCGMVLF